MGATKSKFGQADKDEMINSVTDAIFQHKHTNRMEPVYGEYEYIITFNDESIEIGLNDECINKGEFTCWNVTSDFPISARDNPKQDLIDYISKHDPDKVKIECTICHRKQIYSIN